VTDISFSKCFEILIQYYCAFYFRRLDSSGRLDWKTGSGAMSTPLYAVSHV